MRKQPIYLLLVLSSLLLSYDRSYCHPPLTPQAFLTRLGVPLDEDSLIRAIDDPRPGVLGAAATVLSEKRVTRAIPLLEKKLKQTPEEEVAFSLAQSLNTLGSATGTSRLEAYCATADPNGDKRIRAAFDLVYTGNYSCLSGMAPYLVSRNVVDRDSALRYMLHIPSPQEGSPPNLGSMLLRVATSDDDEGLRELARRVIMQIGDSATKARLAKYPDKRSPP